MKHLSSILLAAAFVATGVTACFNDPTDPLMNGPAQINLSVAAITLRTGDSVAVTAEFKDDAGNTFSAAGAEWTSADANVAVVRLDTVIVPGEAFSRGFVRAVAAGGGVTTVTISLAGLTKQLSVVVLPARLTASASAAVSGTPRLDTIVNVLPGGTIVRDTFTVGDTVTFTILTGSKLTFDATASLVGFGAQRPLAYVSRTATMIKVIVAQPYRGRPWVTRLTFHGTTGTGDIVMDSVQSDTVVVSRFRRIFPGTVTQTGDTVFVNAPTGAAFSTVAPLSGVLFGARAAWVVGRTAAQLKVMSPVVYTGQVTVTNVVVGSATIDSLKTPAATYTTTIPSFGGTVTQPGDTVLLDAPTGTAFSTAAPLSGVRFGARAAWVVGRTATQLKVMSPVGVTGPVTVTNVVVGSATVDSLKTPVNYTTTIPSFGGTVTQIGDTMLVAAPTGAAFSTAAPLSGARIRTRAAWVLGRTAAQLQVLWPRDTTGVVTVTNVVVGSATIDSLKTPVTYTTTKPTFGGSVTQLADTMFLNAPTGSTFATNSAVRFGATSAIVLTRSTTALKVISPATATWTGVVTVTRVVTGSLTIDSAKTPAPYTINRAVFGTVVTLGKLVDVVKVYATAGALFTTTPADSVSNVTIGGQRAWVVLRTADSMYVVTKMPSTGPIAISNVNVGWMKIPSLNSPGDVVISELPTGEPNEPANNTPGAVTINLTGATAANPVVIFGAVDGVGLGSGADADDFFAFTLATARTVTIELQFTGTGDGDATNPDLDLMVCNATCRGNYMSVAGAGPGTQPENITLTNLAAGTYNIYVNAFATGGATRPYKLIVY